MNYNYYQSMPICSCCANRHLYNQTLNNPSQYPEDRVAFQDHGKEPFAINIKNAAIANTTFRTALWTGKHLQVTLMSINVGDDIGLEVHHDHDQFLRIERGNGLVEMGKHKDHLNFKKHVTNDVAIMVPAGMWHNITNTGNRPLKLYSIYAPPEHPFGTIHKTKQEAMQAEHNHNK